jgi:hypothetical protein
LLDYLAQQFIDHGYSIKAMHRETRRARPISCRANPRRTKVNVDKDPNNRPYWRGNSDA